MIHVYVNGNLLPTATLQDHEMDKAVAYAESISDKYQSVTVKSGPVLFRSWLNGNLVFDNSKTPWPER